MVKRLAQQLTPPVLWTALSKLKERLERGRFVKARAAEPPDRQNLGVYWTPQMAQSLEVWGIGNAWDEIEYLLVNLKGKVLDIACGTGKNIELLSRFPSLELHGFDISDFLIQKAIDRGIPRERLLVCDATKLVYKDDSFDYSYSIGSLEHFTEEGIEKFISECHRVTRTASFHQMPVSRSGKNEGWLTTVQSFHNNTPEWWVEKFRRKFPTVHVLNSRWEDPLSVGKWFICSKQTVG